MNGTLDPREAAELLSETTLRARRRLEPYPPWLLVLRAALVLVACGAIWLSVRGQHPYRWPAPWTTLVWLPAVLVNAVATVAVARHRTAGVGGRSRLRPVEIAVLAVIWVGAFVVLGILAGVGVGHAVVYGWYPTSVPLIAAGAAWAVMMAARRRWRAVGTAVAVAAVGLLDLGVGLVAGPAGAWAVAGAGLCVTALGSAAAIAWRQRAA
jgi:hypothetical protein